MTASVRVPESDHDAFEQRVAESESEADMRPGSPAGVDPVRRMAPRAVPMGKAARWVAAERARNARHAADDFDEARIAEAEALFDALAEDPRRNLRKLKKGPEGIDCLSSTPGATSAPA